MGSVKDNLFTDTPKENQYPQKKNKVYFCYMCSKPKQPIEDGCHQDPFDENERICTTCHNHHNILKKEEQDDWSYYEQMNEIPQEGS